MKHIKNKVLLNILEHRLIKLPSGKTVPLHSGINDEKGRLLHALVCRVRPSLAIEVGLAFGISTLFILSAMREVGVGRLIGIDPEQHSRGWQGIGLYNLQRAALLDLYEFHEDTAENVLPQLAESGLQADFAFVDGYHTFDHTLVDFFYIDRMLTVGGVLVMDDVGWPSIKRVCEFILSNRDYELYEVIRVVTEINRASWAKVNIKRVLNRLAHTHRTPNSGTRRKLRQLDGVTFAAFRKLAHDTRRWDHFVEFGIE